MINEPRKDYTRCISRDYFSFIYKVALKHLDEFISGIYIFINLKFEIFFLVKIRFNIFLNIFFNWPHQTSWDVTNS